MRAVSQKALAFVAGALLANPVAALRNNVEPCPKACSVSSNPFNWFDYHSTARLAVCKEPMLLDFSLYNALNQTNSDWTFLACTPEGGEETEKSEHRRRSTTEINYEDTNLALQLASWGASVMSDQDTGDAVKRVLDNMQTWFTESSEDDQFHIFGHFGKVVAGLYVGPRYDRTSATKALVKKMLEQIEEGSSGSPLSVLQHCATRGEDNIGLAVSTNGDLAGIQQLLRQWRDGECPSDHDEGKEAFDISVPAAPSTVAISSLYASAPLPVNRAAHCKMITVELGDGCQSLAKRCGISGDKFEDYNPGKNLCSTLVKGQPVCCSSGGLPDLSPDPFENGTCYTHRVKGGEDCTTLAAALTLEKEDLEKFNENTWGWRGCDDLQASMNICLSKGEPPFPAPIEGAVCGPQKPGTKIPTDGSSAEWAQLNPCPLNACCNIWGWCGINPEFCKYDPSDSGAPGTGVCVSDCGTEVVNDDIPPDEYASVGYFLASNLKRKCLTMNAYSIRTNDYTHIQYAFGNIGDDFSVGLMEDEEEQFDYFKHMTAVKRIISFGGWDFSTSSKTYHIFRNGVKSENRKTFAQNVVDFVEKHDLDGVDFDWEYPGAPDIPGIPAGEEEEGERYLEFLKVVRDLLPEGKSLSIAAPASFWYLQAFPIEEIGALVDYIVYMTYDLRGQWDYDSNDPPLGCPDGNCLRSHINSTETQYALAMITKAQVQTRKIVVGVSSYGRAFEMSEAGCTGPTCTYTGNGAAEGRCTQTSGYLANAEINEILKNNDNAKHSYDEKSDSDILVYNDTQWAAYMTDETRSRRIDKYSGMHMGGSVEWSIDLQRFNPGIVPEPGVFLPIPDDTDIDDFCSEPDWDEVSEPDASSLRNVSAYFDYFFGEVRGGSTSNWAQELFGDTQTVTCDVYDRGQCDFPTPSDCKDMDSPSLYWARFVAANFYQHIVQYGNMFESTTLNASLNIGGLVNDFDIKTPDTTSMETVYGIFAGALGLAGAAASAHGVGPPSAPGSVGGAGAGAALAGFGAMWSIVAAAVEDAEPPDEDDLERALNAQLAIMFDAGYKGAVQTLIAVFGDGDLSDFPKSLREGDWKYDISNFFDGRWLAKLQGKEIQQIQEALAENIMKSLAASALTGANYYIMKDGFEADDCDQTSGKVIDDTCYTLEYPGNGQPAVPPKRSDWSKTVDEDTLELITDKYKIDLEELYKISIACQSSTDDYNGKIGTDVYAIFGDDEKPACFFAVPVFTGDLSDTSRPSWQTPCRMRIANMTADDDDKAVVGETYLPPHLDGLFTSSFCVPTWD
ncbi:uncharacterized protein BJX67DRAFT_225561 [Aspergillus lucknowensis]|uniref:chitinase n=1 Tax=Aspergillus lucknowensis TaxID=176173 RepID=A0ABR4LLN1_9EURO